MSNPKPSRWLKLFEEFVQDLRISSKEVVSEDERGTKLDLWESQRRFLDTVGRGLDDDIRIFYFLKSRQLGITTVSLAIDVFWMAMHNNLTGCLVTDTEKNRDVNRSMIARYVKSFPDDYFGGEFNIVKDNRQFIQFSNGSRLDLLVAGTKKKSTAWGEGVGYSFAHLTECASYGDADGLASLEESFAQQNPNRLFIYESTAKGFGHWRDKYLSGKVDIFTKRSAFIGWWGGDTNFIGRSDPRFLQYGRHTASGEERELVATVARLYGWKITPEQLAWIRWKEATAGDQSDMLTQNQPWIEDQAWVMTGFSFFQTRALAQDIKRIADNADDYGYTGYRYELGNDFFDMKLVPIVHQDEQDQIELKVWEQPVPGGRYVVGCDPAWGRNDHKDRHAVEIYRCFADRLVQVAEFATAGVEVKHCAWILAHLAGAYDDCIVNLELSGPGRAVMMEWDHVRGLMQAQYHEGKVKALDWENAFANARWYLYNRPDTMGKGYAANFETTWRTKQEIMHQMRGAYVTHELDIRSIPLLSEMRIVVQNGSEIGAPESKSEDSKDDRVFATALAVRAWINWQRPSMLADGLMYDRVMGEETGTVSTVARRINDQVFRFFRTQDEIAAMPTYAPKWLIDRGLA